MFEAESSGTEETVGTDGNLEFDDPLPAKREHFNITHVAYDGLKLLEIESDHWLN